MRRLQVLIGVWLLLASAESPVIASQNQSSGDASILAACFEAQTTTPFQTKMCDAALAHASKINDIQISSLEAGLMAQRDRVQYDSASAATDTRIVERQLVLNPVILGCVLLLVFLGVYLSYLQVKHGLGSNSEQVSSFEISRDGFKVRSPVIGLLILCVSLAFFYLYLSRVYRITLLEPANQSATASGK